MNKKAQLRPYVISIVLVILFATFALLFVQNFIVNTNPSSEVLNPKYGINESANLLNTQVDSFNIISEDARGQLQGADTSPTDYLFLIFRGAFDIPRLFLEFAFNGITALGVVLFSFLTGNQGISQLGVIIGVIISVVVVTVVLLIVQAIRTGVSQNR